MKEDSMLAKGLLQLAGGGGVPESARSSLAQCIGKEGGNGALPFRFSLVPALT